MSLIEEALRKVQQPLPGDGTTRGQKSEKPKVHAPPPVEAVEPAPAHSWPAAAPSAAAPAPAARSRARAGNPGRRWAVPAAWRRPRLLIVGSAVGLVLLLVGLTTAVFSLARSIRTPKAEPAPVAALKSGETNLELTGVVLGVGDPYAVINGEILAVGDMIAGATVREITPSAVTLRLADGNEAALRVPR